VRPRRLVFFLRFVGSLMQKGGGTLRSLASQHSLELAWHDSGHVRLDKPLLCDGLHCAGASTTPLCHSSTRARLLMQVCLPAAT
jgi:hypothetical protein